MIMNRKGKEWSKEVLNEKKSKKKNRPNEKENKMIRNKWRKGKKLNLTKKKQNDNSWMKVGRKIIWREKIRNVRLENKKEQKLYWMKMKPVLKKLL